MVAVLHLLLCVAARKYEGRTCDLWAVKGGLPSKGISTLANLSPLHLACNADFWCTRRDEFEVHVTTLDSGHLCDFNTSAHESYLDEYDGSHVVRYRGVFFVPAATAHVVLELGMDGIDASIAKFA